MLIGLLVCILVPLLQFMVTTERERLSVVCDALVKAVDVGHVAAIESHVSGSFDAEGYDKEGFMEFVSRGLERADVENASVKVDSIEINGSKASVIIFADCLINTDGYSGKLPSKWRLTFEKTGDAWKLIEVTPISTPLFPYTRLRDLRM